MYTDSKDTRTDDDFFKIGFLGLEDTPKYAFTEKADDNVKTQLFNLLDYKTPESRLNAFKEIQERSKFNRARKANNELRTDTLPKAEETSQQGFINPAGTTADEHLLNTFKSNLTTPRDPDTKNAVKPIVRYDLKKEPTITQPANKKEQTMWFGDGTYAAEQQKVKEAQHQKKVSENAKMNGKSVWKTRRASDVIVENAEFIKSAAKRHGVNPAILAACIYAEQANNVTITEDLEDMAQSFLGIDCSVGLGQVRVSTAKEVEDEGYMPKTYDSESRNYAFKNPFTGKSIYSSDTYSRDEEIYYKLKDPETNINYAAAYLAMIQNMWSSEYPVISGDTAILATLYNIGENGGVNGINDSPKSNPFGDFAKANYPYMQYLLGIE